MAEIDYSKSQQLLQDAASRTRDVQGVSPETMSSIQQAAAQLGTGGTSTPKMVKSPTSLGMVAAPQTESKTNLQPVGTALVENLKTQEADLRKRAESAAGALEIAGGAALAGVQNLDTLQQSLRSGAGSAAQSWNTAAEKADEYVQAARSRVGEVLTKLDSIYEDIRKTNDFAKAHDMQAAVQASIGSMKAEERNIAQVYGTGSKEYQQFQAQKRTALATVQSNVHAAYSRIKEDMDKTYLSTVSDAYSKANTGVSYQEQQHVEMLNYMVQNQAAYDLKVAELDASLEQMKTAGMENLANWILETPTFSMDATSTVTALSDLLTTQESLRQAAELSGAQTALTSAEAQQMQRVVSAGSRPRSSRVRIA